MNIVGSLLVFSFMKIGWNCDFFFLSTAK